MRRLGDWISSYLEYTENTEPPLIYRKWIAVSVIASVLQRKCYVHWRRGILYPNLYIILIGPSSIARKGTALGMGLKFLLEPGLNIKLAVDSTSRASLIRDLKNAQDNFMDEGGKIHTHSSLTIFSPEITVFLGYKDVQLLTDLIDWYDSVKNPWIHKTVSGGDHPIVGLWVNILGASTPPLIQSSLPMEAIGGGLIGRILFVYAPRLEKKVADDFETEEEILLQKFLTDDLSYIALLSGKFKLSEQCMKYAIDWYFSYDEEKECRDEKFAAYFGRKPTTIMKLCMILSASRTSEQTIEVEDFDRALQFLEDIERSMYVVLSGMGKSKYADMLNNITLEVHKVKECSISYLMNKFKGDVSKWELDNIISTLTSMDCCRFFENTGKLVANQKWAEDHI